MKNKVVPFDPNYFHYLKMWRENRWEFSGTLVKLTIRKNKGNFTEKDNKILATLQRIVDEHDGKWTEGYEFDGTMLTNKKKKFTEKSPYKK
jgi:hypothetical protein